MSSIERRTSGRLSSPKPAESGRPTTTRVFGASSCVFTGRSDVAGFPDRARPLRVPWCRAHAQPYGRPGALHGQLLYGPGRAVRFLRPCSGLKPSGGVPEAPICAGAGRVVGHLRHVAVSDAVMENDQGPAGLYDGRNLLCLAGNAAPGSGVALCPSVAVYTGYASGKGAVRRSSRRRPGAMVDVGGSHVELGVVPGGAVRRSRLPGGPDEKAVGRARALRVSHHAGAAGDERGGARERWDPCSAAG